MGSNPSKIKTYLVVLIFRADGDENELTTDKGFNEQRQEVEFDTESSYVGLVDSIREHWGLPNNTILQIEYIAIDNDRRSTSFGRELTYFVNHHTNLTKSIFGNASVLRLKATEVSDASPNVYRYINIPYGFGGGGGVGGHHSNNSIDNKMFDIAAAKKKSNATAVSVIAPPPQPIAAAAQQKKKKSSKKKREEKKSSPPLPPQPPSSSDSDSSLEEELAALKATVTSAATSTAATIPATNPEIAIIDNNAAKEQK